MNTSASWKVSRLVDRLFVYQEQHQQLVEHIISLGSTVLPELLRAFREREFRHNQNEIDTNHNTARLITKAIVEIATNEQDPILKDRISLRIIDEMAVHAQWHIDVSVFDRDLYNKAFDDSLFNKACEAALAMGQLKDSRALPHLLKVIRNKNSHPTIRENAIIALGQIGDEQAIPHLIDLVINHSTMTHIAINALINIGSVTAVPPLLNCLENVSGMDIDDTHANIIWALGQLGDPLATLRLIEWAMTHKDDMKAVAIQALGNIGDPSAIPALKACLDDNTELHRQDWGGTFWLFRRFRGKKISSMAIEALQKIGTPDALRTIEKWQSFQTNKGD